MRRIGGLLLAVLVLAVALLAGAARAQTPAAGLSISGVVWQDDNADGRRDVGETGIADAEVQLRRTVGVRDVLQRSRTDGGGRYAFTGLQPGQYLVTIFSSKTWVQTYPSRDLSADAPFSSTTAVSLASDVEKLDIGLFSTAGLPSFRGDVWIEGQRAPRRDVQALVNERDCAIQRRFERGIVPADGESDYSLRVAPAALIPGCGREGDLITFLVNGRPANETAVWRSVEAGQLAPGTPVAPTLPYTTAAVFAGARHLMLTVGPPIAVYTPELIDRKTGQNLELLQIGRLPSVEAYVGGQACGSLTRTQLGEEWLVVPSDQLRTDCGRDGAIVRFLVDGEPAPETAVWRPSEIRQALRLTVSIAPLAGRALRPPDTGDAGLLDARRDSP